MTWDDPTNDTCPDCGKTLFKRRGGVVVCLSESCNFEKEGEKKAVKTTTAKRPAAKSADKKPAAKSTETKKSTAAKKPAAKKTTAKKPAEKSE